MGLLDFTSSSATGSDIPLAQDMPDPWEYRLAGATSAMAPYMGYTRVPTTTAQALAAFAGGMTQGQSAYQAALANAMKNQMSSFDLNYYRQANGLPPLYPAQGQGVAGGGGPAANKKPAVTVNPTYGGGGTQTIVKAEGGEGAGPFADSGASSVDNTAFWDAKPFALDESGTRRLLADGTQTMPARPFDLNATEREALIRTVAAEAGGEGVDGMSAVASVILNRAKGGGYGDGVLGVISKPHAFEPVTAAGGWDKLNIDPQTRQKAEAAVAAVLSGNGSDPTNGATHFFSPTAQAALGRDAPSWATPETKTAELGGHVFYRPDGPSRGVQVAEGPGRTASDAAPGYGVPPARGGDAINAAARQPQPMPQPAQAPLLMDPRAYLLQSQAMARAPGLAAQASQLRQMALSMAQHGVGIDTNGNIVRLPGADAAEMQKQMAQTTGQEQARLMYAAPIAYGQKSGELRAVGDDNGRASYTETRGKREAEADTARRIKYEEGAGSTPWEVYKQQAERYYGASLQPTPYVDQNGVPRSALASSLNGYMPAPPLPPGAPQPGTVTTVRPQAGSGAGGGYTAGGALPYAVDGPSGAPQAPAPQPGVRTGVSEQEKAYADIQAKRLAEALEKKNAAEDLNYRIDQMHGTLAGFSAGKGASAANEIRAWLNEAFPADANGKKPFEGVTSYQEFAKLATNYAAEQARMLGAREAASVVQMMVNANPNAEMDPRAIRDMLNSMKAMNDYTVAKAKAMDGWYRQNGHNLEGFDEAWSRSASPVKFLLPYLTADKIAAMPDAKATLQRLSPGEIAGLPNAKDLLQHLTPDQLGALKRQLGGQ